MAADSVAEFIARVDRLEERFKGDKYSQDSWMFPVDLLKQIRDRLKGERVEDLPLFAAAIKDREN
jgi:hypothetical protein